MGETKEKEKKEEKQTRKGRLQKKFAEELQKQFTEKVKHMSDEAEELFEDFFMVPKAEDEDEDAWD